MGTNKAASLDPGSERPRRNDALMTPPIRTVGLIGDVHAEHQALRVALDYLQTLDLGEFTGLGDTVDGEGRSRKRK